MITAEKIESIKKDIDSCSNGDHKEGAQIRIIQLLEAILVELQK